MSVAMPSAFDSHRAVVLAELVDRLRAPGVTAGGVLAVHTMKKT